MIDTPSAPPPSNPIFWRWRVLNAPRVSPEQATARSRVHAAYGCATGAAGAESCRLLSRSPRRCSVHYP